MDLLSASRKVKSALSTKDFIASLTHYHLRDGSIHATNGSMSASAPISEKLEHVVPADELDKALNILGADATLEWSSETLVVKKGRRRITVRLLSPDTVHAIESVPAAVKVPVDFIQAMKRIRPFISDDASRPWALTAWLHKVQGRLVFTATNNIAVAEVDSSVTDFFAEDIDCQIPNFALDFVIERGEGLTHIGVSEHRVSFYFNDGSQMTTQLFVQKMPDMVSSILTPCYEQQNCGYKLTDEWLDAYRSVIQLSPDEIKLGPDLMTAGRKQAVMEVEVATPVPDSHKYSLWNPKFLTPVVEKAQYIDFAAYPNPARFYGIGIRGLLTGKVK